MYHYDQRPGPALRAIPSSAMRFGLTCSDHPGGLDPEMPALAFSKSSTNTKFAATPCAARHDV